MVTSQHRVRQIVETPSAGLAEMALPMRLGLIVAIADRRCTVATGTTDALRPAMVAHQFETLRLVQQRREIDQIGYGGDRADRRTNQMASSSDQIRDLQPLLP